MSAAVAHPCTVCNAASAKYKCPQCGKDGATCSLVCSKQHKERHTLSTASNDAGPSSLTRHVNSGASPLSDLPPLRVKHTNEELPPPAAHRFTNIGRFVPMNRYSDATMLEDFEYLQHVGRNVSALGRDIAKRGWLRVSEPQQPNRNGGKNEATPSANGQQQHSKPLTQEERNRQAFGSWIRRLRLPIMLLPEGMSARKANTSRWKAQTRQLLTTVEIAYKYGSRQPDAEQETWREPAVLHLIQWTRRVGDLVWSELVKRSSSRSKGTDADRDHQLHAALDTLQKRPSTKPESAETPRDRFDRQFCLVIPVNSDRLRNESSTKFLDWWQRQMQYGMVKEGGLELDEEKREAYEKARQARWQGPAEGRETQNVVRTSSVHEQPIELPSPAPVTDAVPLNLITSSLLGQLQAAWHAPIPTTTGNPHTKIAQRSQEAVAMANAEVAEALEANTLGRTVVIVKAHDTFEDVLRRLPKGNAVVEFPHIEVWPRVVFEKQITEGRMNVLKLEEGADALRGNTEPQVVQEADKVASSKRGLDDFIADNPPPLKRVACDTTLAGSTTKDLPLSLKSNAALAGISAYASSDEDCSDDDADLARRANDTDEACNDAPQAGHKDDGEDGESHVSGLADIARALGMAPFIVKNTTTTPQEVNVLPDMAADDDEDAVDYDGAV